MKLKTLLILSGLCLLASKATAAVPIFQATAGSAYAITQTTITVSSLSVTQSLGIYGFRLSGANGYREVTLQFLPSPLQDGTSLFFKLDGSTANIYTAGYVVRLSTLVQGISAGGALGSGQGTAFPPNEVKFETSGSIFGMTQTGIGPINGRMLQKRIPQ